MRRRKSKPANAKSESKSLDFKSAFDPDRPADWCELLKDIVAMANSGGGTILIGVADDGQPLGGSGALKILQTDPAKSQIRSRNTLRCSSIRSRLIWSDGIGEKSRW